MDTDPLTDDNGGVSSVQVLVVEDYEPFRQFVCSTLGKRPELQIVCEASDGLEAVNKAEELQPDLILFDVGLPTLNGIEAARRIRKLSPKSKIVFVSQESSTDVVQEALRLGALGYIAKTNAGIEPLAAVDAACQGRRFVDAGLAGHVPADFADHQAPNRLHTRSDSRTATRGGRLRSLFWRPYPAARKESLPETIGTRAWIVVPR
jgi:DNA-binding NarL/FixJ family response regulator